MKKRHTLKSLNMGICTVFLVGSLYVPSSMNTVTAEENQQTDFFTSFEKDQASPTWQNSVETDAEGKKMTSGIDGNIPFQGIQGDITHKVVQITASANNPPNEIDQKLIDKDVNTKWLAFENTGWIELKLSEPEAVVKYALTSANDFDGRDPKEWSLSGSNDGKNWTKMDERANEDFSKRFQRNLYELENETKYLYYRFDITKNAGDNITQLAEIALSNGIDVPPPPPADMKSHIVEGPTNSYTAKTKVGWTGLKAFEYSGSHLSEDRAYSYNKIYDVNIKVTPDTELSYFIHPEFTDTEHNDYSSTYASVDLAFSDGTYLHDLDAVDQHGIKVNPQDQGKSETLSVNQWNYKQSSIGQVAAGKTIERILVAYDNPDGPSTFRGSIDDIKIEGNPVQRTYSNPSDYVNILRGTQSNGTFSRGNNFPAVAVPHGFNFWTPVTNAGSTSWLYSYNQNNNKDNLPQLQAFSISHEPSPWMGDRQTFQVMPSESKETVPSANREKRALPFKHSNEVAKAHYYSVKFENGIQTEMTPTDHAAMFRFTFKGDTSNLIFDNINNQGGLTLDKENGTISGYSDVKSGLSTGATRMFVYAEFDHPIVAGGKLTGEGRDNVSGYLRFDTSKESDRQVTMKIATSFISVDQAKKNLHQEIKPSDTFETIKEKAQKQWDEKLGIIEVEGANEDKLVTLYSNMYRLFLYPNSGFENVGTVEKPEYKYASPFSAAAGQNSTTETGAKIVDGKTYVNNGFWDTYRTSWPAYTLLTPTMTGEMIDGFVQQYKDGGWISRWSSPGYANLMVGTSSDIAFADAYLKGVTNFDVESFYQSAVKNAAVVSPDAGTGRKGMNTSVFDGFTNDSTGEGMSWAMDGYINDYGIANIAKELAKNGDTSDPYLPNYKDDYQYYVNRAKNYINMFNPEVGFFMGRKASGEWRSSAEEYDPREWGGDYTETNAWNMAFHAPQDGQGLANLYGGREGLADKLDQFFSTPETALHPGHYGGTIHEMREARDVRMGMYGHSNQPSHHIIYMYNYAGQPWKTQEKVREALSRLYIGSEIGQGYAGDEDNGEMSAWYILSAAGIYPLQMGTPEYAIGAPFFKKMTIHLENGKDLVINAPNVSDENKYIQSLKLNGKAYNKTTISHSDLVKGGTLDFEMGPEPSKWGTDKGALPDSVTPESTDGTVIPAQPLRDLTDKLISSGKGTAADSEDGDTRILFDNNSNTRLTLPGKNPSVQFEFKENKQKAKMYTVTSANGQQNEDPKSWVLKGSNDGEKWIELDRRNNETFKWRLYTRAFEIEKPGKYAYYKLEITENGGGESTFLAELELLGVDVSKNLIQVEKQIEGYIDSGDLKGPMKSQLINKLKQAVHHEEKGDDEKAVKHLDDLINHLNREDWQKHISRDAKEQLSADVNSIIYILS
ncbi:GH92 family glycosyl hydrolase [Fictibacillus barbaricus]|nr:GH92 family glycosyl hydrolase [Fictibacillus barbaricus]GGB41873.1 alpha-1 2-mannosidase [Fictibacillus barbaricus]